MSFFGFDATLPRDRNTNKDGRGFFEARQDPFAGYNQEAPGNEDV